MLDVLKEAQRHPLGCELRIAAASGFLRHKMALSQGALCRIVFAGAVCR